jgi:hypothetical protein
VSRKKYVIVFCTPPIRVISLLLLLYALVNLCNRGRPFATHEEGERAERELESLIPERDGNPN